MGFWGPRVVITARIFMAKTVAASLGENVSTLQVWDTALRDPIAYAEIETQVLEILVGWRVVFFNERFLKGR